MIKDTLESNRITIAISFLTFFLALFWGADFLSKNSLIFGVEVYAFLSSSLFFFYLLSTAILYKYSQGKYVKVGLGQDEIELTKKEVERVREWAFDGGINCIFAALFLPPYILMANYTDSIKWIASAVFTAMACQLFFYAIGFYLKGRLNPAIVFTIFLLLIFTFAGFINKEAEKVANIGDSPQSRLVIMSSKENLNKPTLWTKMIHGIVRETTIGDTK